LRYTDKLDVTDNSLGAAVTLTLKIVVCSRRYRLEGVLAGVAMVQIWRREADDGSGGGGSNGDIIGSTPTGEVTL